MNHVSLPDIYSSSIGNSRAPRIGDPYPYKSIIDQQNSIMISKLLSVKKSYDKLQRVD
jgi:hypothetical protein